MIRKVTGRLTAFNWHFAGTAWTGGGGFKAVYVSNGDHGGSWQRDVYYSAADANAATTNQLKTTPVFSNNPSSLFFSTIPKVTRDNLLAEAIPALSPPIGTIAISSDVFVNSNLDIDANRNQQQRWSRPPIDTYGTSFLHSDIKDIALPFLFEAWRSLESCTEQ